MALERKAKTPSTDKPSQTADGNLSANRRRLVKGAFAAPMILTLHSGGAMAARTSNQAALVGAGDPDFAAIKAAPAYCVQPDQFMEVEMPCPSTQPDASVRCDFGMSYTPVTDPITGQGCIDKKAGHLIVATSSGGSLA